MLNHDNVCTNSQELYQQNQETDYYGRFIDSDLSDECLNFTVVFIIIFFSLEPRHFFD